MTREVCEAIRAILMAVAAILLATAIDRAIEAIETWRGARVVIPAAWEHQRPPGGPRS